MEKHYLKINGVEINLSEVDWDAIGVVMEQIKNTLKKILELVETEEVEDITN